jgi:hypothetical protein
MYDEWIEADKTNVETLFGDNDEEWFQKYW